MVQFEWAPQYESVEVGKIPSLNATGTETPQSHQLLGEFLFLIFRPCPKARTCQVQKIKTGINKKLREIMFQFFRI